MDDSGWYEKWSDHDRRFRNWWADHRDDFIQEVRSEYLHFSEWEKKNGIEDSDFGFMVGLPIFILWWLIHTCFCKTLFSSNGITLAVFFLALGFLVRYYANHLANLVCWRYFWQYKYPEVVSSYIENHLEPSTWQSLPEDEIEQFCEHCRKGLMEQGHYITYHSKPAKKRKANK